jgi:hypothetical protein
VAASIDIEHLGNRHDCAAGFLIRWRRQESQPRRDENSLISSGLANELGVHAGVDGSAEQNIALQKAVMAKLAENGRNVSESLRHWTRAICSRPREVPLEPRVAASTNAGRNNPSRFKSRAMSFGVDDALEDRRSPAVRVSPSHFAGQWRI